jgi:hypothetical protein
MLLCLPYGGPGDRTLIQRKSVAHSHGNQCLSSDAGLFKSPAKSEKGYEALV